MPFWSNVKAGADLIGLPRDEWRWWLEPDFVSLTRDAKRRKLSPVGDWNRRTTVSSKAVFSYALRTCFASLSYAGPARDTPFTIPLPASNPAPGRACAAAMKVGSIADGDAVAATPWPSGGEVFRAAVRCSHSFCWVRECGSAPGGRVGGDARALFELAPRPGEGGVWG